MIDTGVIRLHIRFQDELMLWKHLVDIAYGTLEAPVSLEMQTPRRQREMVLEGPGECFHHHGITGGPKINFLGFTIFDQGHTVEKTDFIVAAQQFIMKTRLLDRPISTKAPYIRVGRPVLALLTEPAKGLIQEVVGHEGMNGHGVL